MDNQKVLQKIIETADQKRGRDIVALKTEEVSSVARYMVILDAPSTRQVKAIANEITDMLAEDDVEVLRVDGADSANWILIDTGDILINVFKSDTRDFYNLEKLWSNAPLINISEWITED